MKKIFGSKNNSANNSTTNLDTSPQVKKRPSLANILTSRNSSKHNLSQPNENSPLYTPKEPSSGIPSLLQTPYSSTPNTPFMNLRFNSEMHPYLDEKIEDGMNEDLAKDIWAHLSNKNFSSAEQARQEIDRVCSVFNMIDGVKSSGHINDDEANQLKSRTSHNSNIEEANEIVAKFLQNKKTELDKQLNNMIGTIESGNAIFGSSIQRDKKDI